MYDKETNNKIVNVNKKKFSNDYFNRNVTIDAWNAERWLPLIFLFASYRLQNKIGESCTKGATRNAKVKQRVNVNLIPFHNYGVSSREYSKTV